MSKLPFIVMTIIAGGLAAALAVVLQEPNVSTFEIDQDRAALKAEIRATETENEQYAGGVSLRSFWT
jgi:predicted Zn-dependent peptidase